VQAAVGAGAVDQWRGGPARGARRIVAGDRQRHRREAFALEVVTPLAAHQLAEPVEIGLLNQEVRSRASALAGAGWAADGGGNACGEATLAQRFHLGDRAGHRSDERLTVEERFRGPEIHGDVVTIIGHCTSLRI
jgi:hypothetical protein